MYSSTSFIKSITRVSTGNMTLSYLRLSSTISALICPPITSQIETDFVPVIFKQVAGFFLQLTSSLQSGWPSIYPLPFMWHPYLEYGTTFFMVCFLFYCVVTWFSPPAQNNSVGWISGPYGGVQSTWFPLDFRYFSSWHSNNWYFFSFK